jgi:transcriptional regulator with XRE-family HTH domain
MPKRPGAPGLSERLKIILKEMSWTPSEMARELGIGASTVGNWLHRNNAMEPRCAFLLQDKYLWNARWILEGVGPQRLVVLPAEDETILQKVRELPPERRRALALILGLGP